MQVFNINDIEDLDSVADYIVNEKKESRLFFLKGNLGAGKTTLIQKVCKKLGSKDHVVSPSFALINIYDSDVQDIYHIDLYRLKNLDEAIDLGIEEYLYSGNYCFVEWPGIIESISPEVYTEINIDILEDGKRTILILDK